MQKISDQQMEVSIGRMLQAGVTLSALVVLVGGALYLMRVGGLVADYRVFHASVWSWRDLMTLDAAGLMRIGIVLLIATPVARVGYCVWGFMRQRDWIYVGVSSLVLGILIFSLVRAGW
jgi:uncharacterized membrane protein